MAEFDWAALQKEASSTVLPDGDYTVIVTSAEATTASTGKPMIKLKLAIAEGPKKDRTLFTQFVLAAESPFALQRWFANLACFSLDAAYFASNPNLERIAHDLLNRGAVAIVGHREWQGADRNEVQGFRPYAPNGPVPTGMIVGPVAAGPMVSGPIAGPPPSTPTTPNPSAPVQATPTAAPPTRPF
jgi:hypothetical protein